MGNFGPTTVNFGKDFFLLVSLFWGTLYDLQFEYTIIDLIDKGLKEKKFLRPWVWQKRLELSTWCQREA